MRFLPLLLLPSLVFADVTVNGGVSILDAGTRVLDKNGDSAMTIEDGHLQVSHDITLLSDRAVGTALNTNVWTGNTTTQTIATAGGFYQLNSGAITTISTTSQIQSIKLHSVGYPGLPITGVAVAKTTNLPAANATAQLGFFSASGTAAPTDGCYFEWNATGELRAVTNFNGAVLQSGILTNPTANFVHSFGIVARYGDCAFYVDSVRVALVSLVNVAGTTPVLGPKLPYAARVVNGGVAPTLAPQLQVASVSTCLSSSDLNKPAPHQFAQGGRGAYQSPTTTYGQTANWANSTSPTSATLSNTAAGYTTLGGRYQFAAVAGAATDFALFGFQVPTGLQLIVTGIRINTCNTGATVATTPTIIDWGVAVNSNAVSLATADALGPPPTAWAPRRVALGNQGFAIGALAGQCATDIVHTFVTPLVVDSGRFFHVIMQQHTGTATASEIFRGDVFVEGYFE